MLWKTPDKHWPNGPLNPYGDLTNKGVEETVEMDTDKSMVKYKNYEQKSWLRMSAYSPLSQSFLGN